jgi:hypothetical protein
VLKLGGATALASIAPPGGAFGSRASSALTMVLADPRYAESLMFAGSLERRGAKRVMLGSDLAGIWFDAIAPRVPHGVQGLTGLTLESDFFILERLAAAQARGPPMPACMIGAAEVGPHARARSI